MTGKPRRFRVGSVYVRILASYLSFLVPIAGIGIYSYLHAVDAAKREYVSRIGESLDTSGGMVELALKMAQATCFGFFSDSSVARVFGGAPGDLETRAEGWRIPQLLQRFEVAVGDYTDRVFAYGDGGSVWVSGGKNDFDFFFGAVYRYGEYDADFFRARLEGGKTLETLPPTAVEGPGTAAGRVVPIVMRGTVGGRPLVFVLNISSPAIERTLRGAAALADTRFLVLDAAGRDVVAVDPELRGWRPGRLQLVPGLDSSTSIDGRPYLVSCRAPGASGWRYLALTPLSSVGAAQRTITRMLFLICAVLSVMSLGFAFFFSSVIYNPIRALRDVALAERAAPERRPKDEFAAIRRGLDELRAEGERQSRLVDRWTREYVESAFRFILRGQRIDGEGALRVALEAEYGFSGDGYACAAVLFRFGRDWYDSVLDSERLEVSVAAKSALLSLVGRNARIVALELRQDRLAIVGDVSGEDGAARFVSALDDALRSFAFEEGGLAVAVGVGSVVTGLGDLRLSWDEAMTAASRDAGAAGVRLVEHCGSEVLRGASYTPLEEQELLNALKEGDGDRVARVVDALFDANARRGIDRAGFRALRDDLAATGRRFLAERGVQPDPDCRSEADSFPEEAWGAAEYRRDAVALLRSSIRTAMWEAPQDRKSGLAFAIGSYVESHYDRGLCLERIADELGVSAKYVSRVFKEATGESLTDHIDRVRVAKAKELLLATDSSISEISAAIGIDSRVTFVRVFRRVEGTTPSEYRDRFRRSQ
jgi:AraC-like DNA-binding protein